MQIHLFALCTDCAVVQKKVVIAFGIPFSVTVEKNERKEETW